MRVASWNLMGRSGRAAASLGSLLRDRGGADLVLLQEASPRGPVLSCTNSMLIHGDSSESLSPAVPHR